MAPQQEIRFCKSTDGVDLAMALYGAGPPLVKAATWLTHVEFDQNNPFDRALINEFAPRFRFVSYDARGCGLSQRRVDDISLDAWVRDLEAVVDALGLETFPLLGISQGAAIAVAYAARHPHRVSQLILLGGFATSYFSSGMVDPKVIEEAETLLKIVELGWGSAQPAFRQVFVSKFMPDATAEHWHAFDELQKATATPEVAARYLRAMFNVNVSELAPSGPLPHAGAAREGRPDGPFQARTSPGIADPRCAVRTAGGQQPYPVRGRAGVDGLRAADARLPRHRRSACRRADAAPA